MLANLRGVVVSKKATAEEWKALVLIQVRVKKQVWAVHVSFNSWWYFYGVCSHQLKPLVLQPFTLCSSQFICYTLDMGIERN